MPALLLSLAFRSVLLLSSDFVAWPVVSGFFWPACMVGAIFSAGAFCCAAGAGLDISLLLFCSLFSAAIAALAISSDAATVVNRCIFLIVVPPLEPRGHFSGTLR